MPAGRSSGAARWFCLQEAKAKRGGGWIAWPVENPSGPGGAAGAHSAHKAWAGALGPRPCFGFAGPSGPQNAAAPPPQRPPGRPSGAAAFRGRGHRPRPRNMPAAGLARQRAGGLCPPAAFAVRKGRCASPLKRLPSTPLLTGLPPRFFRHWRRSALPPCRF